jgi:hypothetical protein
MRDNAPIVEAERTFLDDPRDLLAFCAHKSCPACEGHVNLAPGVTKVVIVALVMVTALSTALLLVMSPRVGALLIISIGVALYTYRVEFMGVVTDYMKSQGIAHRFVE